MSKSFFIENEKPIHTVYLNKKIEIDMGLQISLGQNYNEKIINKK